VTVKHTYHIIILQKFLASAYKNDKYQFIRINPQPHFAQLYFSLYLRFFAMNVQKIIMKENKIWIKLIFNLCQSRYSGFEITQVLLPNIDNFISINQKRSLT